MNKKYERKRKSNILKISHDEYQRRKEVVTSFFLDDAYIMMTAKQIASLLGIKKEEKDILSQILSELETDGFVYIDDSKRYVLTTSKNDVVKCVYQAKSERFGFGICENGEDIYIEKKFSNTAMSGDNVLVKITKLQEGSKSAEGQIIKVLKRNTKTVVGRLIKNQNFGFVEPIDHKISDIYIPKKYIQNVKDGQVVEVEILKYSNGTSKSEGRIIKIIGDEKSDNIEVKALYQSLGLEQLEKFPKLVEKELEKIPNQVSTNDKIGREDRTSEIVYTIDGDDAKDLDDGVFVKKINSEKYLLSVYIADVSNYVKDGTFLDNEAIHRGTSIYIPGTVIPMLPRKLSNGICSLNEGMERLSLAIDMEIDKEGNVLDSRIFKTVIKVTKRMTYDKVYRVLTNADEEVLEEYKPYVNDLFVMKELALILNEKRRKNGSIHFDIPEPKIVLDEKGAVVSISPYEKTIANTIIEEFMLIANMTVAREFFFLDLPFIYRIHEKPDEERLRELNEFLANDHKRIKNVKNVQPKVLANLLESFEDEEKKKFVSNYMLRALKLAKYSEECEGHFGLASKYYCHFTSPIRRYPDLFIHRVISDYLDSNTIIPEERIARYRMQAQKYALSSSEAEKQATMIEREFDSLYQVMYMEKWIGKIFEGVVSSVTSFGMFVKLENTVEGLVPFEYMPDDDYYEYDENKKILIGRRTSRIFRLADKVKVELVRCNIKLKQIDFKVVEESI